MQPWQPMSFASVLFLIMANGATADTPVTRVVQLLKGLSAKLTEDAKAEQDVFENYECWYKTVVSRKSSSNSAAESRIESLTAYIADIDAGRIEFTTERADLELQVKNTKREIETAKALRAKERADYEAAKAEMEQAIAALGQAIGVLEEGTSLVQADTAQGPKLLNLKWSLRKVLQVGRAVLSDADTRFLEHALDGDVPEADWKKLNRKATFKHKYAARSGKILAILKDMEQTFEDNLKDANDKEDATQKAYDTLMAAKESMLQAAEDALVAMVEENGARNMSKQEAEDEIEALKAQVEADTKFIAQVEEAYKVKQGEFEERKALRMSEIEAISKAINVLHSDDARDLFKKSYASQGLLLLQRNAGPCQARLQATVARLWSLAAARHNPQLTLLARAATGGKFSEVIAMVDKLVAQLEDEAKEDLEKKEQCETDMAASTREASLTSRQIDTLSDAITKAQGAIEELEAQLKEQRATLEDLKETLVTVEREAEDRTKQYKVSLADDEKAVELVVQAMDILKNFYSEKGLALAGLHRATIRATQPDLEVVAGEAPPPPPATWETPGYGGAKDEQDGIFSILEIVKEDLEKDIAKATAAEEAAAKETEAMKEEINAGIAAAEKDISDLEGQKADKEQLVEDTKGQRASEKENLDGIMAEIKALKPGCDFFAVNFQVRAQKRTIEIDGLKKAKAILEGADFGDAMLLQKGRC